MKRLLALFLAVIMLCALLPAAAFADEATHYKVWIGSTEATSAKTSGTGWSYDKSSNTLTLKGYKGSGIHADSSLKIVLSGANTITLSSGATYGIKVGGSLTITKASDSKTDTLTISQKTAASASNLIQTGGVDKSCTINGGTVTLKNSSSGGSGTGIAYKASVNNDANLTISVPYRGVGALLTANTKGAVNITTTGNSSFATAVYGLKATGPGAVTLNAKTPAVTVYDSLSIGSGAGKLTLNGYTKVSSPDNYTVAYNKKVSGVDNYYQGCYATDPLSNPGYFLTDSSGNPLSSAAYISVKDQPLVIMDSSKLDLTGLKVGVETHGVRLTNATRGGAGNYRYSLKSGSSLPAGLSLSSTTGEIYGTPSKACESGSAVIVVKDNKGASGCSSAQLTLKYSAVKASSEYLTVGTSEPVSVNTNASGIGWSYNASSKTLNLLGYDGGPIKCDTDLKIVVSGENTVTLPGSSESGIKVNGKLTIDKKTASITDVLTVTQKQTTTSANLIVTGGSGESKACVINGGTIQLLGSDSSKKTVGITGWTYVNNDANLNITTSFRGVAATLYANTLGLVNVITSGKSADSYAVYGLNAKGIGLVNLIASNSASTVYNSLNVANSAGTVTLNGYTRVSSSPYSNMTIGSSKRLDGVDSYYLGYNTTSTVGKGYYLTDSAGKPIYSASIVTEKEQPLKLMDSAKFDISGLQVGTKYTGDMYLLNATRGGSGGYTYSVKSGSTIPAGLTVNSKTGLISGTPTKPLDKGSFIVVVKDSAGATSQITINYAQIKVGKVGTPTITASNSASSGKPVIKWNTDNSAQKYEIYRASSKSGNYSKIYTTKDGAESYTNSSASIGKTYYYKVRAIGYDGAKSAYSNVVSRTCDCARPVVKATNLASTGNIKLSWSAVSGAKEYTIYRASSVDGTYSKMYTTTNTSYTNTSATAGKTYYYKVKAIASSGSAANSAYSSVVSRTRDCARPSVTTSNSASSGKITLKWSAVSGASKYEVWRATSKNGSFTKIYTTTKTSCTNTSAKAGQTYYYKVRAIASNTDANSAYSSVVSRMCDCARPSVSVSLSNGHPRLSWSAVDGADRYTIYRASSADGTYSKLYTTQSCSYTNTSAKAGQTYYYKVVAISDKSSSATSAYSTAVSIKAK